MVLYLPGAVVVVPMTPVENIPIPALVTAATVKVYSVSELRPEIVVVNTFAAVVPVVEASEPTPGVNVQLYPVMGNPPLA